MRRALALIFILLLSGPALADPAIEAAFKRARQAFERALPDLGTEMFGVDIRAYGRALLLLPFRSPLWEGEARLDVVRRDSAEGSCGSYAAFVRIPPEAGRISLTLCPEFFTPGTEALRALTILHEVVHVVAGPDECRAMALAARIEASATGSHTPVERYWQANGCAASGFSLP